MISSLTSIACAWFFNLNVPNSKLFSNALFNFFNYLSASEKNNAYDALLKMSEKVTKDDREGYYSEMEKIYHDFEKRSVGEMSLTKIISISSLSGILLTTLPASATYIYVNGWGMQGSVQSCIDNGKRVAKDLKFKPFIISIKVGGLPVVSVNSFINFINFCFFGDNIL